MGTVLSVVQAEAGWFGEGDDLFYVDGEAKASLEGTGTEDYFNDAWSLHVSEGLYTGVPVAEGTGLGSRMSAYRWHLTDPVPFTKSLRFEMEHKGWTFKADGAVKSAFGERTDLLSSVAFWYQQGIAQGLPEPPYGAGRLPQGNALQIEVDKALGRGARRRRARSRCRRSSSGRRTCCSSRPRAPGRRVEVPFDVPDDGDYEVYAELARGSDYGIYTVLLDGKKAESARPRARAGGGRVPADRVRRLRPRDLRGRAAAGGLAAAHEGTPHPHLRVPRQARDRLRPTSSASTTSSWRAPAPRPGRTRRG